MLPKEKIEEIMQDVIDRTGFFELQEAGYVYDESTIDDDWEDKFQGAIDVLTELWFKAQRSEEEELNGAVFVKPPVIDTDDN